jgi:hypothetical protein
MLGESKKHLQKLSKCFIYELKEKRTRMLFIKTKLELERDTRSSYSGVADYSTLLAYYAVPTGK